MTEPKTKRLRLVPMTAERLEALTRQTSGEDTEMATAYNEMLDAVAAHPQDWLWYTNWEIQRRTDGTTVGGLCFKGGPLTGAVELGYGIDAPHQKQGYATEAIKAAVSWAFSRPDVYFVMAETDKDNGASIRVLEKNGFKRGGMGEEGPRWIKEKPAANLLSVFMSLGVCIGVSMGAALQNLALGTALGISLGVALGAALDLQESSKRKKYKKALGIK